MDNILIVDDLPENLVLIEDLLLNPKYNIKTMDRMNEALEELKNKEYQILISDICMPEEKDGYDFINKVNESYPQIIIIAVSGHTEVHFVIKILSEKKVYDYILKPIHKEILKLSVERALETYHLRQKKDDFVKQEEAVFKDVIQIFDWKKEINSKYLDSLAPDLIRQINISMLQGSGIGSLSSALSIFLTKAIYQLEQKNYLIPEKIFNLIKQNYEVVNSLLVSLSDAQALMQETEPYKDSIPVSFIVPTFKETVKILQPMLEIKDQSIKLSNLPQTPQSFQCIFNKEKMKIVIHELLINAMKYSGSNDSIYILFFSSQDSFDIKILNKAYLNPSGSIGITGKNESRVFEPFFRLQNIVDDNYSLEKFKFGLGLTIVKKILQLHNADISIYNVKNNIDDSKLDVCVWMRFPYIK